MYYIDKFIEISNKELFIAIVNASSLISLALTIWVLYSIRSIKKSYVSRARIPELIKKLEEQNSKISDLSNDFDNSIQPIQVELANIQATLSSLSSKTDGSIKKSTNKLIKLVKLHNSKHITTEETFDIYLKTSILIEEINNLQEDQKWRQIP